ncbi:hypothetical protein MTo_00549 [Microcystis aeruginosa NIES-1211]|uniref:Uncharacterized protein n=1 Tax=Microcystis aeruginosa NIES-2519 TaxID=2303981 RepID=A0A5A5R5T9_MICAE|nr:MULTISPECIES: hypothetical protein [Microcystis]GBL13259.1 hypothetical protein MTo_00549 [Microcystis aeruginosa NIES-1211]GCA71743.1 hypothetical protein MiYa_03285 [Microcystis aeruginosa NIES-2519]GCA84403.1 hypothetical protein MiHa_02374 [Microcystis aeruginosa NIES-2522]GCA89666.1 hypothetical protein MiTa_03018 [Microcystis aeruginosa NIES-4264]
MSNTGLDRWREKRNQERARVLLSIDQLSQQLKKQQERIAQLEAELRKQKSPQADPR